MKEERIISLDALRGFAAFAVAIPHFSMAERYWIAPAEAMAAVAVEIFFILSGFVLAPQILYCIESDSIRRFEVFLARRWMRTLPVFGLALYVTSEIHHKFGGRDFFEYLFFLRNLWRHKEQGDFFPIAWSLSIEEWFYVVFPCALMAGKLFAISWSRTVAIYLGIFFIFRAFCFAFVPEWTMGAHREVIFRLDAIAFGFCLYCAIKAPRISWIGKTSSWIWRRFQLIFIFTSLLTLMYLYLYINYPTIFLSSLYFYVTPFFAALILLCFYRCNGFFKKHALLAQVSDFLGAISYSVYLFHYAVIVIINYVMASNGTGARLAVFVVSVTALSYFLRINFEAPILSVRPSYRTLDPGATLSPR